jgi:hypothetical protein
MKVQKIVEACETLQEQKALAYAVVSELGVKQAMQVLWECFFVNGTPGEIASFLEETAEAHKVLVDNT